MTSRAQQELISRLCTRPLAPGEDEVPLWQLYTWPQLQYESASRRAGISLATEAWQRLRWCRYIRLASEILQLRPQTTQIAQFYFAHFLQVTALNTFDARICAIGCVVLATKGGDEDDRRIRDILNACHAVDVGFDTVLDVTAQSNYFALRQRVLQMERRLLLTFDFHTDALVPANFVLKMCASLGVDRALGQLAWTLAGDAMCTDVSLLLPAHAVAAGALNVAAAARNVTLGEKTPLVAWWTQFDVNRAQIAAVSDALLDVLDVLGRHLLVANAVEERRHTRLAIVDRVVKTCGDIRQIPIGYVAMRRMRKHLRDRRRERQNLPPDSEDDVDDGMDATQWRYLSLPLTTKVSERDRIQKLCATTLLQYQNDEYASESAVLLKMPTTEATLWCDRYPSRPPADVEEELRRRLVTRAQRCSAFRTETPPSSPKPQQSDSGLLQQQQHQQQQQEVSSVQYEPLFAQYQKKEDTPPPFESLFAHTSFDFQTPSHFDFDSAHSHGSHSQSHSQSHSALSQGDVQLQYQPQSQYAYGQGYTLSQPQYQSQQQQQPTQSTVQQPLQPQRPIQPLQPQQQQQADPAHGYSSDYRQNSGPAAFVSGFFDRTPQQWNTQFSGDNSPVATASTWFEQQSNVGGRGQGDVSTGTGAADGNFGSGFSGGKY
ncbi:MAG: hypothetical protein MHM6MM_000675 [Cercozoa sp. M6MM]